jgi:hypothetical protein
MGDALGCIVVSTVMQIKDAFRSHPGLGLACR